MPQRKTVFVAEVARPTLVFRRLLGQAEPILITGGRAVADCREAFVGIDVAKLKNAIAVAESGGEGEIRFWGEVDASDISMRRVIQRIAAKFDRVHFCYEAGPTGYGLHRLIRSLGHECLVVAPSLIPRKPGDRVKTNRRDALGRTSSAVGGALSHRMIASRPRRSSFFNSAVKLSSIPHACPIVIQSMRPFRIGGGLR